MIKMLASIDVATLERIRQVRTLSLNGLSRMFQPEKSSFVFRARRNGIGVRFEGDSPRYTAIVLIGLAGEPEASARIVFPQGAAAPVSARLVELSKNAVSFHLFSA